MSLKDAFDRIKQGQDEPAQSEPRQVVLAPKKPRKSLPSKAPAVVVGKSSNPDYVQLKVYVRADTRKLAARKWEDQGGRDVSDLVEQLLNKYLST